MNAVLGATSRWLAMTLTLTGSYTCIPRTAFTWTSLENWQRKMQRSHVVMLPDSGAYGRGWVCKGAKVRLTLKTSLLTYNAGAFNR